jgi:hypothetical protein
LYFDLLKGEGPGRSPRGAAVNMIPMKWTMQVNAAASKFIR